MLRAAACTAMWVVCLVLGTAAWSGEPTEFRFNPPDETTFVETVTTTQVVDLGGGRRTTRETKMKGEVVIRKSESGHTLAATLKSAETASDRPQGPDVAIEVLKGVSLTYAIDKNGRMTDVSGLEAAVERFREAFPSHVTPAFSKLFTKEVFLAAERADWDRRVASLTGRSASRGSVWLTTEQYLVPSGEMITYYVAVKVHRKVNTGGHECVRILYEFDSDPTKLKGFLGEEGEAVVAGKAPFKSDSTISGDGYRLVDPTTLLCYGERLTRNLATTVTMPGHGEIPFTMRQVKNYEYDYRQHR